MANRTARPDFSEIVRRTDLVVLLTTDLGAPEMIGGKPSWHCPFHDDKSPSLELFWKVDIRRWTCRPCGISGNAIDWLVKHHGISKLEAARRLDPSCATATTRARRRRSPAPEPVTVKPQPVCKDPAWQSAVDRVVCEAEETLWGGEGRAALGWLGGRGLDEATIRRFRLGFNPRDYNTEPVGGLDGDGRPRRLWVRRGVTFPWVSPESWYSPGDDALGDPGPRWVGCNVRRLADPDATAPLPDKPKWFALAGSERGHGYPWPDAVAGVNALVTEGEIDALTALQEAGHVVNVVSFGGAGQVGGQKILARARAFLDACPAWLVAFDDDENLVGLRAANRFIALDRTRAMLALSSGFNDLNDLHRGGSLLDWLRGEFERLGWPWPLRNRSG